MLQKNHISLPILLSGITALSANARNFVEKASAESPNLIYIISDQLRFDALSCMGNTIISTPNMDRLAAEGVIFTRAYSQSPVSVPSRACMLTGNSPCNTGIWGNSYAYETGSNSLLTGNEPIYKTKTYDEVLSDNGYTCEYYGKWHSPESKAYVYANRPITCAGMTSHPVLGLGLSDNYANWWKAELKINTAPTQTGALTGGGGKLNYLPDALDARVVDPTLTTTVDYQNFGRLLIDAAHTESTMDTKHAIDAIERNKTRKFSIHCSFGPPHPPFVVALPYYGSLNASTMPIPANYFVNNSTSPYYKPTELNSPYFSNSISKMGAFQNPSTIGIFVARYYEMVKEIDDKLGEILKKLDDTGLSGKTMIVFCGDHGEMLGSHGMNSKNNFYDESARVPLIIRFPGKIPVGKRINIPVNLIDIRPTIEDYLNMPETKVDGKSLKPFIEDTYNKNESYFAISEWYNNDKIPGFMVRTPSHKLMFAQTVETKNTAIDGLYNLVTDSLEQTNILKLGTVPALEMEKAQELKVLLVKWLNKVRSPYYYSVKARPVGRMNADFTLYQNDVAKIKIPGITSLSGLKSGITYRKLTNDTVEITTSNLNTGLTSCTANVSGVNITYRFEIRSAIDYNTSIDPVRSFNSDDITIQTDAENLIIKTNFNEIKGLSAKIISLNGKTMGLFNFTSSTLLIDKNKCKPGIYIIHIMQGHKTWIKKVHIR